MSTKNNSRWGIGVGPHQYACDALCDGSLFAEQAKDPDNYILQKHALATSLLNETTTGTLSLPKIKFCNLFLAHKLPVTFLIGKHVFKMKER